MLNRIVAVLAVVAVPLASLAQVPGKIGYQGRLLKASGEPETGIVEVQFALFPALTGGTSVWNETQRLGLSDGFYSTFLGDQKELVPSKFDGSPLYLEVTVAGKTLSPRQPLASVPYAMRCADARNVVGGSVNASSISVNGTQIVNSSGQVVSAALGPHKHDAADLSGGTIDPSRLPRIDADKLDGLDSADFAKKTDLTGLARSSDVVENQGASAKGNFWVNQGKATTMEVGNLRVKKGGALAAKKIIDGTLRQASFNTAGGTVIIHVSGSAFVTTPGPMAASVTLTNGATSYVEYMNLFANVEQVHLAFPTKMMVAEGLAPGQWQIIIGTGGTNTVLDHNDLFQVVVQELPIVP